MAVSKANFATIYIGAKDGTREALSSAGNGLMKYGAVLAGVAATVMSVTKTMDLLKESAKLMDFQNIGVGIESAIQYSRALEASGMSAEGALSSFQNLSEKVAEGINDEALQATFKNLGVSVKDLKNAKIEDIFEKIYKSAGSIEDKTKALAEMKKIFGEEGITIFNNAQDERAKRIIERVGEYKQALAIVAEESNKLFGNIGELKSMLNDDFLSFLAPILPIFNAVLETIIQVKDEFRNVKEAGDIAFDSKQIADYAVKAYDVSVVIFDGFNRAYSIVTMIGKGILLAVNMMKDMALSISFLWDQSDALQKKLKDTARLSADLMNDMKKDFNIAFSPNLTLDAKAVEENRNKLVNNLNKAIEGIGKPTSGKTSSGPRTGINVPVDKNAFKDALNALIEEYKLFNEKIKNQLDMQGKWNELFYANNQISLEKYYDEKIRLSNESHKIEMDNLNFELKKKEELLAKTKEEKERKQIKNEILGLQNKIVAAEEEYKFKVKETNIALGKDRIKSLEDNLKIQKQLAQLSIDEIAKDNEKYGLQITNNNNLINEKKKYLKLLEDELALINSQIIADPQNEELKVKLKETELAIKDFKDKIDPIATQIKESFSGAFSDMFMSIFEGTKSAKDMLKDFAKAVASTMMKIMADNWGKQLAESMFPSNSGGGGGGGILQSIGSGIMSLLGRATGGYVDAGVSKPYLVGENGPELYFPGRNGMIVNARQTQELMSGGGSNSGMTINMNVTAKDAQSFNLSRAQVLNALEMGIQQSGRNR